MCKRFDTLQTDFVAFFMALSNSTLSFLLCFEKCTVQPFSYVRNVLYKCTFFRFCPSLPFFLMAPLIDTSKIHLTDILPALFVFSFSLSDPIINKQCFATPL